MRPTEFWGLTPYLFSLIVQAENQKTEARIKLDRWNIWHIAGLTRTKKMPKLLEFIGLKKAAKAGIDEASIKTRLKAYQDGKNSKSKR